MKNSLVALLCLSSVSFLGTAGADILPGPGRSFAPTASPSPLSSPIAEASPKSMPNPSVKASKSTAKSEPKSERDGSVPELLREVEETYTKAGTLFAEFSQTNESAATGTKKTSSGRIAIKRPDKVRWETTSPDPNLLVSDGKKAWYYTAPFDETEHGQVSEYPASRVRSKLANAILSGEFSGKDLKIKTIDVTHFSIIPKKGTAANVKEAKVKVDPSKRTIVQIEILYDDGNRAQIDLSNIKLGEKLGDDVFVFQAPPNTDHINQ
jgi:outer membrane lipoprotein carrier protein